MVYNGIIKLSTGELLYIPRKGVRKMPTKEEATEELRGQILAIGLEPGSEEAGKIVEYFLNLLNPTSVGNA